MRRFYGLVMAVALLACGRAFAHHAFTPVFDADRTITIEGVVTEFKLVNPHASIAMDVTDDAGQVVAWVVEMSGKLNLTVGGWTEDSIRTGDRVTVSGNPTHSGSPGLFLRKLVRADGTELLTPGAVRRNALEEARRQRAEQRSSDN